MSDDAVKEPDSDTLMSFWDHLDELRVRVMRAAGSYVVAIFVAWYFKDPIFSWLWNPFADSWRAQHVPGEPELAFAAPSDMFQAYFKLSMIAGLGLAAPVIFWELWAFIAPGLYKKEKRWSFVFVLASSLFFVGGALFGWRMAVPITFKYFLGLTGEAATSGVRVHPTIMMGEYLDFVGQTLLAFGLIFELPLFITLLSILGLVNYLTLYRFGRWFIMIAAVVGAVLSPPDTTSMILMTTPLIVLYFLSIGLAYLFGQKPSEEQIERDRRWREDKRLADEKLSDERRQAKRVARAAKKKDKEAKEASK